MTKQELMENYTIEQLADKVIELEEIIDDKLGGWSKHGISYNDFFSMRDEIDSLKDQLQRKETAINQIDDILNELFGVTHNVTKPDEFKEILKEKIENSKTIADFLPTEPIEAATELINAAYTRNKGELENKIDKAFGNTSDITIEQMYSISELRQIAEHLLIYCNANGEE